MSKKCKKKLTEKMNETFVKLDGWFLKPAMEGFQNGSWKIHKNHLGMLLGQTTSRDTVGELCFCLAISKTWHLLPQAPEPETKNVSRFCEYTLFWML